MHNNNSDNLKINFNIWGNSNVNMSQQQQQQSHQLPQQQQQQQQQRITNWIADTNKSQQQHLNQNNNNNNNNKFANCNNVMQQQQLQQNYVQQQYNSYRHHEQQQQAVVATTTTLPSINYYEYQQQQQQSQQHHLQQQQQQQQPQQAQPPLHSPYAVATAQQQQHLHASQHLQQQQQQQLIAMDDIRHNDNCTTISTNTTNKPTPDTTPAQMHNLEEDDAFMRYSNESFNAIYQASFDIPPLVSFLSSPTIATVATSTYQDCNGVIKTENEEDSQASFMTIDNSSINTADYIAHQNISNARGYTSLSNSAASSPYDFPVHNTEILTIGQTFNTLNCIINNEATSRRNRGGRRPAKTSQNVSPEEEEKRRIRRERNKLAAARCRQRRVEQTQTLLLEVEQLEQTRNELHKEFEKLNVERNNWMSWLEKHCRLCPRLRQKLTVASNYTESVFSNNGSNYQRDPSPIDLKPNLYDMNKSSNSSRQV